MTVFRHLVLLLAATAICLGSGDSLAQRKKKKAPEKPRPDSSKTITADALFKADSLVVEEFNLPLSDSADDRPMFSLDGSIMVFGSRRPPMKGETWRQQQQAPYFWDGDIYYRVFTDTGWSIPINAGPQVNNGGDQNNPTITPMGDEIVYRNNGQIVRSKFINGTLQKPEVVPGDIQNIYAQLANYELNFRFSLPQKVSKELDADSTLTELFARAPDTKEVYVKERMMRVLKDNGGLKFFYGTTRFESAFTPDGHNVIFSENFGKKGEYGFDGVGDDDLWVLTVSPNGHWDTVKGINGEINSSGSESYPFIAADGQTLYFTSDRPCYTCKPDAGGFDDIYMSRLNDKGFSKPVPLPGPINSPAGDYGFTIAADGQTAYFVSNRTGKSKFYRVHFPTRDSAFLPIPVMLMQGRITDKNTGKPLKGEVFVDDLASERNSFSITTNDSGIYLIALQRGHRLGLQAISNGYLPKSERVAYPTAGKFNREKLDFQLAPIEVGATTEFKNVYFAFGKADLLPESKLELNRAAEFLKKNKNTSIEIDGHTDDIGSDGFNNKLSLDRANAVLSYIATQGISKDRMQAKGFGKSKPVKKGSDEATRAQNRRVEMIITSYSQ